MENSQVYTAVVPPEREGERLDVFTAELADITRSRAGTLIRQGSAIVDGATQTKAGFKLKAGAAVRLEVPPATPVAVEAEDIALDILYQDDDLAVVFKPSGMVVHPAAGNENGTLVNALLKHLDNLSGIGGEIRPGIVHRIDKDTSGLLLVAKNDFSHVALSEQIRAHTVKRAYRAIVIGGFREDAGTVEGPIGRHPTDRKRMAVVTGGREATTHFKVLQRWAGTAHLPAYTHLQLQLETGRTHQIRVHMAHTGHPVVGDPVYGNLKKSELGQSSQVLHARQLVFRHPRTEELVTVQCELPDYFQDVLRKLGEATETLG